MRYPKDHKAETRARILKSAAKLMREKGTHGVGVVDVMHDAGLTHGGFYAHFDSREDLVAEAAGDAMARAKLGWRKRFENLPKAERFAAYVEAYLSAEHRDKLGTGCAVAAIGPEIAREGRKARTALRNQFSDMIDIIADEMLDETGENNRARATAAFATMVGSLVLARLSGRREESEEILQAGRALALSVGTSDIAIQPVKPTRKSPN
jgi:TetR/AcrR family transcriptional repressor of nem operon